VITIDIERCSGCGACVEICPTSALYLVDGKAVVDEALCNTCKECLAACPVEAIMLVPGAEPAHVSALQPAHQARPDHQAHREPLFRPEPEVIHVRTQPVSLPARVLPMAGAALVWAGREILPRLADVVLDALDRRSSAPQAISAGQPRVMGASARRDREESARGAKGAGHGQRRHRRRRRGG
jgi:ferredoxin